MDNHGGIKVSDFSEAVKELVADKGISEELVLKTIEMALLAAYKKKFGTTSNAETVIDTDNHTIRIYSRKTIVDNVKDPTFEISLEEAKKYHKDAEIGDELLIEVKPEDFGRIAAQTAKQVVRQRLKEIEKDVVYNEYKQREGEMIVGYYQRERGGNIYVNLGKAEGILSKSQQSPREHYKLGDRIKALLLEVRKDPKGPQIILSRSHPEFVKKIFELEVPEIADGTIVIKNIVRDPGYRTKVAVYSPRDEVDPVGACVGLKGIRIQAIVSELEGEKIDIVRWDPDIRKYIANAMNPVKIQRIIITDEDKKEAIIVVPETQLSIAIGRQGQNIRLVSKLVGWKLDVITEKELGKSEYAEYARKAINQLFGEVNEEEEEEVVTLRDIPGIDEKTLKLLEKANLINIGDIIDKTVDELALIEGMDKEKAKNLIKVISENVEVVEEEEVVEGEIATNDEAEEEVEYYQCPNCGAKITEDMENCPSCGVELEFKDDSEENDNENDSEESE
ncbi:MAG: transcription termination/antitermination protein NusA [Spirochaetes bacterium]|nr:MAG: transcription termination/antitermination protein NusA [Spirochaetota bacterium]RKX97463.1 MAG: transcription termination/antitermination protein NusA [Spirochaetota bacterium]